MAGGEGTRSGGALGSARELPGRSRFNLLQLDPSESYLAEAVVYHAAAHHAPQHPLPRSQGKLHICMRIRSFPLSQRKGWGQPGSTVTFVMLVDQATSAVSLQVRHRRPGGCPLQHFRGGRARAHHPSGFYVQGWNHSEDQQHSFTTIRSPLGPIKPLIAFLVDSDKLGRSDVEAAALMEEREEKCYFTESKLAAELLVQAQQKDPAPPEDGEEGLASPARVDPRKPQVLAFGYNNGGQLGLGTTGLEASPAPLHAFRGLKATEVACGGSVEYHSAVVTEEGELHTCGCGQCGQLGHGGAQSLSLPKMVAALNNVFVLHVACGSAHTVVVTQGGAVWSWGWGSFGQLGHGHALDVSTPAKVVALEGVMVCVVACGSAHTAVASDDGRMYTWGWGMSGQLGHGEETDQRRPVLVQDLVRFRVSHIACGLSHTIASASTERSLFSWGSDDNGQLGHGRFDFVPAKRKRSPRAIRVMQGKDVRVVACGSTFSMAVTAQRQLYVFGGGEEGQLGSGASVRSRRVPTLLGAVGGVVMVAASGSHAMLITEQGRLYSWGLNCTGQLGLGHTEQQWEPMEVMKGAGLHFRYIACAGEGSRGHSVAIATAAEDRPSPLEEASVQSAQAAGVRIRCQAKACVHVPYAEVAGILCVSTKGLHFRPFAPVLDGEEHLPLASVYKVRRRRFCFRQVGLEVYLCDNFGAWTPPNCVRTSAGEFGSDKSILLSFATTSDREAMFAAIEAVLPDEDRHKEDEISELERLQKAWLNEELSNFEYLMQLNMLADRSFNDLSQYPVVPWVITDYESEKLDLGNPAIYRDLSKPVGGLNKQREERLLERFREMLDMEPYENGPEEPYIYGTHYSAPLYVMYYLLRQTPELTLHNRGGTFERPDRSFYSIAECFKGVCSNDADVKELIPEFYASDGSFLLNSKALDLGERQDGTPVGDVVLPPWAADAGDFVRQLRVALESEHVSRSLHRWIDLVFGYQQSGKAAVDANNVFHPRSYDGKAQWEKVTSGFERKALREQVQEFGQCPRQLFRSPHPPKVPQ